MLSVKRVFGFFGRAVRNFLLFSRLVNCLSLALQVVDFLILHQVAKKLKFYP